MRVNLFFQKDCSETLISKISENLKDAKKFYLVSGTVKENGFYVIEEELLDTKIKSYFLIGIDKKNTTRTMLEAMLKLTKDVYVYKNNSDIEFNANVIVIEKANEAVIYNFSGNVSDSNLKDNDMIYTEITYDLSDKEEKNEYKLKIKQITSMSKNEKFENLTKEMIETLIDEKEIFSTKQYIHNIPSISELLGKKDTKVEEKKTEESENVYNEEKVPIPKVDLSDIDLEIEIPEEEIKVEDKKGNVKAGEEIEVSVPKEELNISTSALYDDEPENNEEENEYEEEFIDGEAIDINDLLFEKADMKLEKKENKKEEKKNIEDEEVINVKKLNLNNVSNLVLQLPSRPSKGQDLKNIKVPNYIRQMIPEFFSFDENAKNEEINGSMYKIRNIELEIIDVNNDKKYIDKNAKIMLKQNQTYTTFTSELLENVNYEEKDIVRIIKLSNDVYHMEVISKELNEYNIWNKMCTQNMKSCDRKYGMM